MGKLDCCKRASPDLIPNPQTGLTARDVKRVRDSWQVVRPVVGEVCAAALVELFEKHPQLLEVIDDTSLQEAKELHVARAQAIKLGFTLGALISVLDDTEVFVALCARLGSKFRQVRPSQQAVHDLKDAFLGQAEQKLGKKHFPAKTKQAWDAALDAIADFVQIEDLLINSSQ